MAGPDKTRTPSLNWTRTFGFERHCNWVSLLQTSGASTDISAFLRKSEQLTYKSEHTVFIISNQQELQEQNKTGHFRQKWLYPVIMEPWLEQKQPGVARTSLGHQNCDQQFIYDITCVQTDASEWWLPHGHGQRTSLGRTQLLVRLSKTKVKWA